MPIPPTNRENAAELRARAAEILAQAQAQAAALLSMADRLDPPLAPVRAAGGAGTGGSLTAPACRAEGPSVRRVPDEWHAAAKYIDDNPDQKGDTIAKAAGLTPGNFRNRVVPWLKAQGYTATKGAGGYWPPADRCHPPGGDNEVTTG